MSWQRCARTSSARGRLDLLYRLEADAGSTDRRSDMKKRGTARFPFRLTEPVISRTYAIQQAQIDRRDGA